MFSFLNVNYLPSYLESSVSGKKKKKQQVSLYLQQRINKRFNAIDIYMPICDSLHKVEIRFCHKFMHAIQNVFLLILIVFFNS